MKYFIYDQVNETMLLNKEQIMMVREFEALMKPVRNKTTSDKTGSKRTLAAKELKFMFLYYDWESPYYEFEEDEKFRESLKDSKLKEEDLENKTFKLACEKYDIIQNSSVIGQTLKSAQGALGKLRFYLDNIDLQERDPMTGKPIFKAKELMAEVAGLGKVIDGVRELEKQFKKDLETDTGLRGDKEGGMFD